MSVLKIPAIVSRYSGNEITWDETTEELIYIQRTLLVMAHEQKMEPFQVLLRKRSIDLHYMRIEMMQKYQKLKNAQANLQIRQSI